MIGRRSFLTLTAVGMLAGVPALAAQAPGYPHRPHAAWRHGDDHWAGRRVWLERREVHRFRRWARGRHFARRHWHRHWDGMI
jgi:hypothetical protein